MCCNRTKWICETAEHLISVDSNLRCFALENQLLARRVTA